MENTTHSTKRKKRRTRKCLNEIRNRSRRSVDDRGNSIDKSSQKLSKVCVVECSTNNRFVTMDRLTLKSIFPKAISSETITRPALAEIKHKQKVNLVDMMKEKIRATNSTNTNTHGHESIFNTAIDMPVKMFSDNTTCKDNIRNHDYNDAKSSNSFALFSPTSPANKPIMVSKVLNEDPGTSTLTSPSSQISHGECRHLYEEFMNEIPSYFKQLTSSIIREDGIKNTINHLQKLYVESCQKEYEANMLKCINERSTSNTTCSPTDVMVENPMNYIRLEHLRSRESSSAGSAGSEGEARATPAPPSESPPPPPPCEPALYDTPEYNYYPHRLN